MRNIRLKSFWNCWRKEYLVNLREHDQVKRQKSNNTLTPTVGDIVLIGDKTPRSRWRLAQIVRLISGADDVVRAADVKISNGHVLQRALQHLYPLEVNDTSLADSTHDGVAPAVTDDVSIDVEVDEDDASDGVSDTDRSVELRPRRQAAIEATNRLRAMSQ